MEAPANVLEKNGLGALNIKIALDKNTNVLKYSRWFFFGGKGQILFTTASYKPLKGLFDGFHKADTQTISLKQKQ